MSRNINRRELLRWSGALLPAAAGIESLHAAERRQEQPKNIIWMVADGMSPGVLPMGEHFSLRARGKGTIWHALGQRPEAAHALMDMASLGSIVTDSSSASSSWSTGSRILNGWVNMLPDGTALTPIGVLAKGQKKRVGLVTTTTVTHATPAGFAAVSRERDDEAGIAVQYLKVCDVVLGGGTMFFLPAARRDKRDLVADYREAGFAVALTRDELQRAAPGRILGLFSRSHLPFSLDVRHDDALRATVPTLAEMAQVALDRLSTSPDGFLLQIEGGRVDHAAHNNDAAALLWDLLAFDDAVGVVLRFCEEHPDTLVVITSDHGNSNPGVNGTGTEYMESTSSFERLLLARRSYAAVTPLLEGKGGRNAERVAPTADHVKETIRSSFGIDLSADETEWIQKMAAQGRGVTISKQLDKMVGVLGQVLGNHTGVGWTGTSHTSDYTMLVALGPGSGRFHGFMKNIDAFPILCDLMEIRHRNPSMTEEKAGQYRKAAGIVRAEKIHWA
ncbi:MAG: alkaline phosphatase [Bryobacterales bacterium]|nr:alkaline phosphatase [Bryobacterales bacterium]